MFARQNRHAPELSGANCYTKLKSFETVAEKYLFSDVSTLLFTDEKNNYTENPKELRIINRTQLQEEKHRNTKRLRSTFRQSLMALVCESQVVEKTAV